MVQPPLSGDAAKPLTAKEADKRAAVAAGIQEMRIHYTTIPGGGASIDPDLIKQQYTVGDDGLTKIIIAKMNNTLHYLVQEPPLSNEAQVAYGRLMRTIQEVADYDVLVGTNTSDVNQSQQDPIIPIINKYVDQEADTHPDAWQMWDRERDILNHYLIRDLSSDHYHILDPVMQDAHIEDTLVTTFNKPVVVVHNDYSNPPLLTTNITFPSSKDLSRFISRQAQSNGKPPPTDYKPHTSFATNKKYRVTATMEKITPDSPTLSIRKPAVRNITIRTLLKSGMLSPELAAYLWCLVDMKQFGVVVGSPSTGKTSMINALMTMGNPAWHYFLIEDTLELNVLHQNVTRHQTTNTALDQSATAGNDSNKSETEMGIFDLCKISLRFRPDFVVVGEVLDKAINEVVAVAASGSGCLTTFHATSADHAFTKMQNEPFNVPKAQMGQINFMMFLKWQQLGNTRVRVVSQVTESHLLTKDEAEKAGRLEYDPAKPTIVNTRVFNFDVRHKQVIPTDPVEIVETSTLLKQMAVILDREDPVEDLNVRIAILKDIMDDPRCEQDHERIFNKIMEYYFIK